MEPTVGQHQSTGKCRPVASQRAGVVKLTPQLTCSPLGVGMHLPRDGSSGVYLYLVQ